MVPKALTDRRSEGRTLLAGPLFSWSATKVAAFAGTSGAAKATSRWHLVDAREPAQEPSQSGRLKENLPRSSARSASLLLDPSDLPFRATRWITIRVFRRCILTGKANPKLTGGSKQIW